METKTSQMDAKITQMDTLLNKLSSVHSELGVLVGRMNAHLQTLSYAPPEEVGTSSAMGAPAKDAEPALPTANALTNCILDQLVSLRTSLAWLETI